ncbi:MAG: helix-turn-helix transcriptional regulator [Hyphomicrobiales bacterium]|nr:helix-turn-helix transcriptional regulator [Hyphomicrobiales bacterium]
MELREIFAANLRRYRQEKGVSQEDLAHQAGLDRTYISALERCVYSASLDVIAKIAAVLEIEPFQLLEDPNHR